MIVALQIITQGGRKHETSKVVGVGGRCLGSAMSKAAAAVQRALCIHVQGKTLTCIEKVESVIGPVVHAGELGAWSGPAYAPCQQR